jgi:hypothetical protein
MVDREGCLEEDVEDEEDVEAAEEESVFNR